MSELKLRKVELNFSSSSKVSMAACAFTWHVNANNTKMMCVQYLSYNNLFAGKLKFHIKLKNQKNDSLFVLYRQAI